MIAEYRSAFNAGFKPAKYAEFLSELDHRCGTHVKFRNCETPCFFPRPILQRMVKCGRELISQITGNAAYLQAASAHIPAQFKVPNEAAHPLFIQADFGLDSSLNPKLVEIQGFPSLYAYQPLLAEVYRDVYHLDPDLRYMLTDSNYWELLRKAILGDHAPENTILMEINPSLQKTLADFLITEQRLGVRTVSVTDVHRKGSRLFHGDTPIHRIYNRVIVDELEREHIQPGFDFRDDVDVEWAGHPNWYFLLSKFSIPWLKHECVPRTWLLHDLKQLPDHLENYVLKPLFSFAGLGVKIGPTRDEVAQADPAQYILQEKIEFAPVIETPFGPTKAEVRIMYVWLDGAAAPEAVTTIIRMGRGKMMGVDHNRDMEWVGASAGFTPP
ncbi:MAG: hypothetical protein M3O35_05150 [Acidobacteriota bacterium]|nr:hypothetical protein [Acidobacteriota bacterium]